jgi:hypothetical protein
MHPPSRREARTSEARRSEAHLVPPTPRVSDGDATDATVEDPDDTLASAWTTVLTRLEQSSTKFEKLML